jgi:hypothetical protein
MSNFSDKARSVIAAVAPTLGIAIGGPFGALAGQLISKAVAPNAKPGDSAAVEAALASATPETLLALKNADNELKEHMRQLDINEEQLAYADTDSARKREMAVKDSTPAVLAYVLVLGTLLLIGCTMFGLTKVADVTTGTMIGYLISECKAALGYYFGSSVGSKDKDQTIAAVVNK